MTRHLNAYLNQRDYWMSVAGEYPLADMDMTYRRRALKWLVRNSSEIFRLWTLESYVEAEDAPGLEQMIQWIDIRPQNWVRSTPLYLALMEGVPPELIPEPRDRPGPRDRAPDGWR